VTPENFTVPPKSEFGLEISYRPLIVAKANSRFILRSNELGEFIYMLELNGLPAVSARTLHFKASLGSDIVQTFKFMNYVKKQTAYTVRIEKIGAKIAASKDPKLPPIDFTVDNPTINAPPSDTHDGVEVPCNIRFEPSVVGESRAQLTVTSPEGGEYQCYLIGTSVVPQPKGPYEVAGKGVNIDFKNPFFEAHDFILRIDNPSFTSGAKSPLKIDGRKTINISVNYKQTPGHSANGRLTLQVGDLPSWTFYLQGKA